MKSHSFLSGLVKCGCRPLSLQFHEQPNVTDVNLSTKLPKTDYRLLREIPQYAQSEGIMHTNLLYTDYCVVSQSHGDYETWTDFYFLVIFETNVLSVSPPNVLSHKTHTHTKASCCNVKNTLMVIRAYCREGNFC